VRIAIVSDIHGNLTAFEAVLASPGDFAILSLAATDGNVNAGRLPWETVLSLWSEACLRSG